MTINISIPDVEPNLHPQITVLGVGGSGGNAVNNMINSNLEGVDFVIANTDAQALQISNCKKKIQLGMQSTRGLGAGMRPNVGKQAAEETLSEIGDILEGSHMLFIAAGMGGGTGTGAAPVIAKLAREKGILTVGVVTKPFHFEGSQRMKLANEGLDELQQYVDTLLTIPNQNLFRIANEKTTFADAFKMADDVLYAGVRGVTDLMVQPGMINLDFSDVKTVMSEMGKAMMGTGEASGEGRAVAAAEAAIANPLIDDVSLKGAKGLIINITGGNDITLYEVDEAANRIKQEVDEDANIIYGTTCDDRLEGLVRVSIVATGIDVNSAASPKPLEAIVNLSLDNSVYTSKSSENDFKENLIEKNTTQEHVLINPNGSFNSLKNQDDLIEEKIDISTEDKSLANSLNQNLDEVVVDEISFTESIGEEAEIISENTKEETEITSENLEEEITVDFIENEEMKESEIRNQEVEENSVSSVRRLSLFDSLEKNENEVEKNISLEKKTEPIFQRNKDDSMIEAQGSDSEENNKINQDFVDLDSDADKELAQSEDVGVEDDFNQEPEEELLDIPTFLRRQAN